MIARTVLIAAAACAFIAGAAQAGESPNRSLVIEAPFEDVVFDLKLAIEERGYVIDNVSFVGDMLNRTAADVGATTQVYDFARVTQFCSATLSRKMMEADPDNLAFCPYGIYAYQLAGETDRVHLGYRRLPEGAMQEVQALLEAMITEVAAGLE